MPGTTEAELAEAIFDAVAAGARIVNISAALIRATKKDKHILRDALDHAAHHQTIVIVAAGNQGSVGSTAITGHPSVLPVVALDGHGRPTSYSNLGRSIACRGLGAPGDRVVSLGVDGSQRVLGGTSVAAPFVTGAVALLQSEFPSATRDEIRVALRQGVARMETTIVPPLLNAWASYRYLLNHRRSQR